MLLAEITSTEMTPELSHAKERGGGEESSPQL